jgi:prepilin-type N-terminal cleavage/methylation domain-containing protein
MIRKNNSRCVPIAWQFRRPEVCAKQGFTLAEVLIAIAIFALLVSIVMGSFNGVFLPTEALTIQRRNNEMARACLDRITVDLKNIYVEQPPLFKPDEMGDSPPRHAFHAGATTTGTSRSVLLQLTSKAHVPPRPPMTPGLAVIRYYLEPAGESDKAVFRLRRADTLLLADALPEPQADPILCENVQSLQFRCIDADGEEYERWRSSDPETGYATPRAIVVRLELAGPSGPNVYETTISLPVWRAASGKV